MDPSSRCASTGSLLPWFGFFFGRPLGVARRLVRVPGRIVWTVIGRGFSPFIFKSPRFLCLPFQSCGGKQGAGGRHAACTWWL